MATRGSAAVAAKRAHEKQLAEYRAVYDNWPKLPPNSDYAEMVGHYDPEKGAIDFKKLKRGVTLYTKYLQHRPKTGVRGGYPHIPRIVNGVAEDHLNVRVYTGPGDRRGGFDPSWSLQQFQDANRAIDRQNQLDAQSYDKMARYSEYAIAIGGSIISAGAASAALGATPGEAVTAVQSEAAAAQSSIGAAQAALQAEVATVEQSLTAYAANLTTGSALLDAEIAKKAKEQLNKPKAPNPAPAPQTPTSPQNVQKPKKPFTSGWVYLWDYLTGQPAP